MSLASLMVDYLQARGAGGTVAPLAAALDDAGRRVEARLLREQGDGGGAPRLVEDPHTALLGHRAWVSARPPAGAAAGDVWFDTCELSLMVLVTREPLPPWEGPGPPPAHAYPPLLGWLGWRATARWQFEAFVELAELAARDAPVPPLAPFDRARWGGGDETAPITDITRAEAMAYARFVGKTLGDLYDWQCVRATMSPLALDELWAGGPGREWLAFSLTSEPDRPVVGSPGTLDLDPGALLEAEDEGQPQDPAIVFRPWDHFGDVGFRTAVPAQGGLLLPPSFDRVCVGDRRLVAPLLRPG